MEGIKLEFSAGILRTVFDFKAEHVAKLKILVKSAQHNPRPFTRMSFELIHLPCPN